MQTKARLVTFAQADEAAASFTVERGCTASELCAALGFSKPVSKRAFAAGQLSCAGEVLTPQTRLRGQDTVRLAFAVAPTGPQSEVPAELLWHDRFACAANKPSGLLVHGDGSTQDTLTARVQTWLAQHAQGQAPVPVPQALQRLDVGTSGVVLFSLTQEFQPAFDALVAGHAMQKCYLAVVRGAVDTKPQRIVASIARDRHNAQRMRVSATGKPAATRVMCLERRRGTSLVACLLETGRRHQIRVHLASIGHPLINDTLYGGPRARGGAPDEGLMLHAARESFTHPVTGENITLSAPWPCRLSGLYSPRPVNWSILEIAFS